MKTDYLGVTTTKHSNFLIRPLSIILSLSILLQLMGFSGLTRSLAPICTLTHARPSLGEVGGEKDPGPFPRTF